MGSRGHLRRSAHPQDPMPSGSSSRHRRLEPTARWRARSRRGAPSRSAARPAPSGPHLHQHRCRARLRLRQDGSGQVGGEPARAEDAARRGESNAADDSLAATATYEPETGAPQLDRIAKAITQRPREEVTPPKPREDGDEAPVRAIENGLLPIGCYIRAHDASHSTHGSGAPSDLSDPTPIGVQRGSGADILAPFTSLEPVSRSVNGQEDDERLEIGFEHPVSSRHRVRPEIPLERPEAPRGKVSRVKPPVQIEEEALSLVGGSCRHPPEKSVRRIESESRTHQRPSSPCPEAPGDQDIDVAAGVGGGRSVQAILQIWSLQQKDGYPGPTEIVGYMPRSRLAPQRQRSADHGGGGRRRMRRDLRVHPQVRSGESNASACARSRAARFRYRAAFRTHEHPRDQRVPRRRISGPDRRRQPRGRGRGGALHPPQARHLVPPPLDPLLPRDRGSRARGHRPLRPVPQPAREPRTPRAPRPEGPSRAEGGRQAGLQPPEDPPSQGHAGGGPRRPRVHAPREAAFRRAPHRAHRLLVLRLAVRTGCRALDRRVRRLGERDVGRRGGSPPQRSAGRLRSPTPSASSTPPSRSTSASRSTATSTR